MKSIITILSLFVCNFCFGQDLEKQLDSIYSDDQKYRLQLNDIEKKYGAGSKELKECWQIIREKDSVNIIKVRAIIDQYGWPSGDIIGKKGSKTLFLVIQHADIETQEKYLPIMREAVKNGNAAASQLALLEDRVALRRNKKQIYGSQIGKDPDTKLYYVRPLEDPDHVNERRASVGLEKLEKYIKYWDLKWDAEQYKKDLPAIEVKERSMGY